LACLVVHRQLGTSAGILAGLLVAVLPASFHYSQIGFVDHHAAVALASLLVLWAGLNFVGADLSRRIFARDLLGSLILGFTLAFALLGWPGCLLHVVLMEVILLSHVVTRPSSAEAARAAALLSLANLAALALISPFSLGRTWELWGPFHTIVLSRFQPWFFALLSTCSLGLAIACHQTSRLGRIDRLLVLLACALASLGVSMLLLPELTRAALEGWSWFTRAEEFQARVRESMPLFSTNGRFSAAFAEAHFSRLLYLAPFAALVVLRLPGSGPRAVSRMIVWWAMALLMATLIQRRFMNSSSLAFSLLTAWATALLWPRLPSWLRGAKLPVLAFQCTAAAVFFFLLLPSMNTHLFHLQTLALHARGEETLLLPRERRRRVLSRTSVTTSALRIWSSLKRTTYRGKPKRLEYSIG
jgi:asparagine N-glycosylation enzyme membrane subunit Stt3